VVEPTDRGNPGTQIVKTGLRWVLLALGLGGFAWFIHRAGPAEIFANVGRLGWWTPVVLAPYFLVYLWDTLGWFLAFGSYAAVRPGFLTLFRVRWAAESINSIIPSAYLGSEALKVYLLQRRGFPGLTASTSVVASKTCQILAEVLFLGLGALAALSLLPAKTGARAGLILVTLAAFGLAGLIFLLQRRGMFSTLHDLASRLSIRRPAWEKSRAKLRQLDDQIYAFYRHDRTRFFQTTAAFLAGWLSDSIEVYVVCHWLGLPLGWTQAIAIESFISVAKAVGILVPGAWGVQESGIVLTFAAFGLPAPIAVAYAIIRRGREFCYVLTGGGLLYSEEASRRIRRRSHRSPADSPAAAL
jgi:glycosyltransferase 2 family protein